MLYYYEKNRYGKEYCERFDTHAEFQKWCRDNIPENDEYGILRTIFPGDDLRELCHEDNADVDEMVAVVADADNQMKRPYTLICWGHRDYEAFQSETDVDWKKVYFEWQDSGNYTIQPTFYEEGEITPEEAITRKMYLLAEYIREDLGLNNEDNDNDNE